MTPDPTQHLADTGRRVRSLARLLLAPAAPPRLPRAFAGLLLDPTITLSDVCAEVLDHPHGARGAAGGGDLPYETDLHPFPDPGRRRSPIFPHADAANPWAAAGAHGSPNAKTGAASWPDTPAFALLGSPSPERTRGTTRLPSFPEEAVSCLGSPGTPDAAHPGQTTVAGDAPGFSDRFWHSATRHADTGGAQYDSSPAQERSPAQLPTRGVRPSAGWADPNDTTQEDARSASQAQRRTTRHGLGPLDTASSAPEARADSTRLASGSERLAATLRAQLEASGVEEPPGAQQHGADGRTDPGSAWGAAPDTSAWTASAHPWPSPSVQRFGAGDLRSRLATEGDAPEHQFALPDYGVGRDAEPGIVLPASHADLGEIMERLADELELEFIRTYGSSGG